MSTAKEKNRGFTPHRFLRKKCGVKGFTLIELLVVISIISLLSSVVFSSLGSARDKAQVAAGLQFEGQVFRAYAADTAIALYEFEDTASAQAQDTSGNNQPNLVCNANTVRVPGILGNALRINTTLGSCSSGSYKKPGNSEGTISFWIRRRANYSTGSILAVSNYWITFDSNRISFNSLITTSPAPLDQWAHILYTWKSSGATNDKLRVYVNGRQEGSNNNTLNFSNNNLYLGPGFAVGTLVDIDRFVIYSTAIY